MLKSYLAIFFFCINTILSWAFEGTYDVQGYDPYEKMDYQGSLTIKKDKNGVYQANWLLKEGKNQYNDIGTGLKISDDTISFIFKDNQGGSDEGVQIYTRMDDKTLEGPWVLLSKNLVGKETLIKRK
jgi:hypothetical protein